MVVMNWKSRTVSGLSFTFEEVGITSADEVLQVRDLWKNDTTIGTAINSYTVD